MESEVGEKDGVVDNGGEISYKDALLEGEPESDFHPDPSILASHQQPKKEGKDVVESLKTSLLISGAVIAAIGAIMVVAKKIKET